MVASIAPTGTRTSTIMESVRCSTCQDQGYLDLDEYCDCEVGAFYEGRDELNLQIESGELDIGQYTTEETEPDIEQEHYSDDDYYDFTQNAPWVSDEEWNLHDNGQCLLPCAACAYEDSCN